MAMSIVMLLVAYCIATGRLDADWHEKAVLRAREKAKRNKGADGIEREADFFHQHIRGEDDFIIPMANAMVGVSIEQWAQQPGGGSDHEGPTCDFNGQVRFNSILIRF